MLAHELRNPLAPIANSLEAIRLARDDPESIDESVDIAGRQIAHMARMLDDLLDVSRFTRGNVHLQKVRLELEYDSAPGRGNFPATGRGQRS